MPEGATTRGRGACADAGRRFGDGGLGSGHFSETERGKDLWSKRAAAACHARPSSS